MITNCISIKNGTCGFCKEQCEDFKPLHKISQEEYDRFPTWEDSHPEVFHRTRGRDYHLFDSKKI